MSNICLTSVAYQPSAKLLVTGFNHGAFLLHEMPEVNLIHSLKISNQSISSISINPTGDWIALGCADMGQLLVWEWQSETYVMKQQGHFDTMSTVCYSPDGSYLATGGQDSKVKGSSSFKYYNFSTVNTLYLFVDIQFGTRRQDSVSLRLPNTHQLLLASRSLKPDEHFCPLL